MIRLSHSDTFLARDFLETKEGLYFAVVENQLEAGIILCFLRYHFQAGHFSKLATDQANRLLAEKYPEYLFYSKQRQVQLHGLRPSQVETHFQPIKRLQEILEQTPVDQVEADLKQLCQLLTEQQIDLSQVGVTGSVLISAQNPKSDIDLVFYCRHQFQLARKAIAHLISLNEIEHLHERDWYESYCRRDCELEYAEYLQHELRKFNKALINQRKFDISLIIENKEDSSSVQYLKLNPVLIQVKIVDDRYSFDYPAIFMIEHPEIERIISYTATYTGQAEKGDWVEVSGMLEQSEQNQQIVVGSSREARGEYIKTVNHGR